MLPLRLLVTCVAILLTGTLPAQAQTSCNLSIPFNAVVCLSSEPVVRQSDIPYYGAVLFNPNGINGDYLACPLTQTVMEVSDDAGDFSQGYEICRGDRLYDALNHLAESVFHLPPTTRSGYLIRLRELSTGYTQTLIGPFQVQRLPSPYLVRGGGTYAEEGSSWQGPSVTLAGSDPGVMYQLVRNGSPLGDPVAGTGGSLNFGPLRQAGNYTVQAYNGQPGCQQRVLMTGSATVALQQASDLVLVTAPDQPYPAGVRSLTLTQAPGNVLLNLSGCPNGFIVVDNILNAYGGGPAITIPLPTDSPGTFVVHATCLDMDVLRVGYQDYLVKSQANFFLTVLAAPRLSVLHRDADYGNTQNNSIKPYLELVNAGSQPIPYRELTLRYWLTSEGNAPPTNQAVYYAVLGAVQMRYVALDQPHQGAYSYVEYSFPGDGTLAANGNSGAIETGIQKTDGSNFDESDDYSYQGSYADYTSNSRITAYRNGTLIWGQEPTVVAAQTAVAVYTAAKDDPITSQIQARVELCNTGNVALPVSALKLRYYFTSDNNQPANVYVDYAAIGAGNLAAQVVRISPVSSADSYVELSFPGNTMMINPLSSLGYIDFRIMRSDYGLFDQSNDYSYAPNYGNMGLNNRTTAYLNNNRVFGIPPSGAARVIAGEPVAALSVKVLGNPVVGNQAQVEIRGAEGQTVSWQLVDLQGKTLQEQRIEQAGQVEPVSVSLGQSRGLLLKVKTTRQQQVVKLLRP